MARYTIKRILWIIPILIGVITIVFFISAVTPGNPAASLLGPSATTEEIQEMEHVLGLDQPLIKRWVDYIIGIFTRFDFGTSYVTRQPVRDEIFAFFPVTLQLFFTFADGEKDFSLIGKSGECSTYRLVQKHLINTGLLISHHILYIEDQ